MRACAIARTPNARLCKHKPGACAKSNPITITWHLHCTTFGLCAITITRHFSCTTFGLYTAQLNWHCIFSAVMPWIQNNQRLSSMTECSCSPKELVNVQHCRFQSVLVATNIHRLGNNLHNHKVRLFDIFDGRSILSNYPPHFVDGNS